LPKRIVHWTAHEVFWECWSAQASERRPAYNQWTSAIPFTKFLPGDSITEEFRVGWGMARSRYDGVRIAVNKNTAKTISHHAQPPGYIEPEVDFKSLHDLVEDYSNINLTRSGDKLIAISSLAVTFRQKNNLKGEYLASLGSDDIVRGLLWKRQGY